MRRREFIALLGGAAAWPLAAHAQLAMPVIGFMSARSPEDSEHLVEGFRRGLREGGFVEGQNVAIEFRWARGQYDLLPAMAADLVSRGVSAFAVLRLITISNLVDCRTGRSAGFAPLRTFAV
jgi:putative tryptophan/tyrosine transport system substrate-binding protein